jgi:hypothetical protein
MPATKVKLSQLTCEDFEYILKPIVEGFMFPGNIASLEETIRDSKFSFNGIGTTYPGPQGGHLFFRRLTEKLMGLGDKELTIKQSELDELKAKIADLEKRGGV